MGARRTAAAGAPGRAPAMVLALAPAPVLVVILLAALAVAPAPWARAGNIRMAITAEAVPGPEGLALVLRAANQGDEPASALQAQPLFPPGGEASGAQASLPAGGSHQLTLRWPRPHLEPGRHAVIARLDYADPRDYPLSALAHAAYTVGPPQPPVLAVRADPLELAGQGELRLVVKNPRDEAVAFVARVFCPRELSAAPADREMTLAARGQAELVFDLENFTGQVGARYPVLVLLSARVEGRRYDQVIPVVAELGARDNLFRRYQPWWLAALILLGLALVWRQVRGRRGEGKADRGGAP